jgi:membrane protein implicated in regulation of membrane protease activity
MRRVTWFIGGVAAGVAGAGYTKRKVKATASQISPVAAAQGAAARMRNRTLDVVDAIREGRATMQYHEDELRARRDGRLDVLADHVAPGDRVYVDGVPVESGRVIVMRERRSR